MMATSAAGRPGDRVMDRRAFLGTLALLTTPLAAEAQPAQKVHRIGFLGNSTAALETNLVGPFREGLRELGYVEGQNIVVEYRWAEGKYERFPVLIAELIALKVDLIVTAGTPASLAVKRAIAPPGFSRSANTLWMPSCPALELGRVLQTRGEHRGDEGHEHVYQRLPFRDSATGRT